MIRGAASSPATGARALSVAVGQRPALQLDAVSRELEGAGFEVRCAATTCSRLSRLVSRCPPDVALVHGALDPAAPLSFVKPLREAAPGMPIVVLFDELDAGLASAAVGEEVDAVVLGDACVHDLVCVLERVANGEAVYPAGWLHAAHRGDTESIAGRLSSRQREVLELLAEGLDNSCIADHLHISPNTVKFHIRLIYERLGVTNRVQATRLLESDRASGAHSLAGFPIPT